MKKVALLLLFVGYSVMTFSQAKVDSLLQVIAASKSTKEKAKTYFGLSRHFADRDNVKAIEYADLALESAQECRCVEEEYDILVEKGIILQTTYQLEEAEAVYQSILDRQDYFSAVILLEKIYMQYGGLYYRKTDYAQAVSYFEKAIEIAKEKKEYKTLGGLYCNVGVIYHSQEDYEKAKKFYYLAIEQLKIDGDLGYLANIYSNLSKIVGDKGGDLNEGLALLDSAYTIYQQMDMPNQMAAVLGSKGDLYSYWDRHEASIQYSKMALALLKEDTAQKGMLLGGIFKSYLNLGQYEKALEYGEKALAILDNRDGELRIITGMHQNLVRAYTQVNDGANARKYFEKSLALSDSLYSLRNQSVAEEFDVKFETAKKEKEIIAQKLLITQEKNTRHQILIGGAVLFLLASFLFQAFYFRAKRKSQAAEKALFKEQQEAEKLRELDQLKSTFFTNISHELRTPLTLVAAPLNDALQEVKPSPLKSHLTLAHSNTQKLLQLVNEILDLSKLEAGKVKVKLSTVPLLETVRRLFYSFESMAQIRGLQLVFNSTISKDLIVYLDSKKFEKIMNNLFSNAIKFTARGGTVALNANQKNGHFQFEVADDGLGISAEELPQIFDRFYQSTTEGTPLQGGTGIGLSLAKELAQLLKGDLTVASEINAGSRFTLELPLALVDAENPISKESKQEAIIVEPSPLVAQPSYIPLLVNGQKPRILIIEDNKDMSDYLSQCLSKDYQCTKAYDGLEALKILENQSFDLITSDVMMPSMDGFSFREKLIQNPEWRQIPFVMLTARSMEEDKIRGLRLGVDDYLTKPFQVNELKARLHNLLSNKLEREAFQKEAPTEEEKPLTVEEQLLKNAETFVLKRIDDTQLRVEDLAKAVQLSTRQLSRTMGKLIGISPVNFILEIRLQKARQLLERQQFSTVSEIRYEIGIESASYFTKKFTERFGRNPKDYLAAK